MGEPAAISVLRSVKWAGETVLDPVLGVTRQICRVGVWMGGTIFVLSAVLVTVEVFIRKVFTISMGGADEISAYGLSIATAWAFGFALLERAHIRVDSLYILLPLRIRAALDVLNLCLFLTFFGVMLYYAWAVFTDTFVMGTRSGTGLNVPLAYPQFVWVAGLLLTVLVAALLLFRAMIHLFTGEVGRSQLLIGTKSIEEEVQEELTEVGKRLGQPPKGVP